MQPVIAKLEFERQRLVTAFENLDQDAEKLFNDLSIPYSGDRIGYLPSNSMGTTEM